MLDIVLGRFSCPFAEWTPAQGRVFDGLFAYDTETTKFDDDRPYLTPHLVLAAACDGRQGVLVPRAQVPAFFSAHAGQGFIAHNAAFDLKVTQAALGEGLDLYDLVERNKVWDTLILKRLFSLATAGHTARGEAGLDDCALAHLGLHLPKGLVDADGMDVRTGFGRFLGRPLAEVPEVYLRYAAGDPLATWHLFWELNRQIKDVLRDAPKVWGYVDAGWLRDSIRRFGPLTHHIQLRASIVTDVLRTNGIAIDQARRAQKLKLVEAVRDEAKETLRRAGYLVGEPRSNKAMQSILAQFAREHPEVELALTASGEKYSTAEEDLAPLASEGEFFAAYARYRAAEKLASTYLRKMDRPRLHPKFGYLVDSGRTSCGGGFNLQNLPREKDEKAASNTIRGCFVPGEGKVFIDADFSQIELVVLAYALGRQFGLPSNLASLINGGQDVHRLIAAAVLDKDPEEVTKPERDSAKPVSFGRPGGMGAERLRQVAKAGYGKDLTTEEVEGRIAAYHRLCPELDAFLDDDMDTGLALARALHLTPADYGQATGRDFDPADPEAHRPQAWLGGMLLKVLRDETPITRRGEGRPYTSEEIDYFWERAQGLEIRLRPKLADKLAARQADVPLWDAVRRWAGRRPMFTVTGRLRANTTFSSSRNNVFQGAAADGAVMAMWNVWRAGYKLVDFVHDQVVVESPADDQVPERVAAIEGLNIRGMLAIVPGMAVKVETVVTRSLNKTDLDPRYNDEAGLARRGTAPAGALGPDVTSRTEANPPGRLAVQASIGQRIGLADLPTLQNPDDPVQVPRLGVGSRIPTALRTDTPGRPGVSGEVDGPIAPHAMSDRGEDMACTNTFGEAIVVPHPPDSSSHRPGEFR